MNNDNSVYIISNSIITTFGITTDTMENVFHGISGARDLLSFDSAGMRSNIGCEVKQTIIDASSIPCKKDRTSILGLHAVSQAFGDGVVGDGCKVGFSYASVGSLTAEEIHAAAFDDISTRDIIANASSADCLYGVIMNAYQEHGPIINFTSACAAGANALGYGLEMVKYGISDVMITCGAASLCRTTYAGFNSLRIHARTACRPFDRNREGVCLGEAGACMVLATEEYVNKHKITPLARITGYGMATDTYHVTEPDPTGAPVTRSINEALAMSGKKPSDIEYVNAHGTGTKLNDLAEAKGIKAALGREVPVSSTKGSTGHTMEAAGALEAIICVEAFKRKMAPPNCGLNEKDPECDINVIAEATPINGKAVLSISAGFGGGVAALVLESI